MTTPFSPIQINWPLLKTDQMANLYKFGHLLFPGLTSPGMLKTILNLENEMHRVLINVPSVEREKIQESLEGITLELKVAISDESMGEIISIPVRLEPAGIMKRAILGKGPAVDLEAELTELKKGLFEFITKEGARMMKESIEGFFKGKAKEGVKGAVKELVQQGAITRTGKLKPETTISDLLIGKYSQSFGQIASQDVVNEGLAIEQTLLSLYEWGELALEEWARDVKKDLELIEQSLEEMRNN